MRSFVLLLIFSCAGAIAQEPPTLSLEEALRRGMENNRLVKAAGAKVEGATAKAREAGAALLPAVKMDAGYRRLSDVDPFQVRLPFYPDPIVLAPNVLDTYSLRLQVFQPVFTGFRLSAVSEAAEFISRASEREYASDKADLVVKITTAYWTVFQLMEMKKVVHENLERLESYLKDTENLVESGMATRNDLLKINVQTGNARIALIDVESELEAAMMILNVHIGNPVEARPTLTSLPGEDAERAGHVEEPDRRPDIQALSLRVEAARADVDAAQGNWWPQIGFSANYYYSRPNQRYQPTRDEFKSTWDVGVQLQFDIWNWGATSSVVGQARATLKQAELLRDQARVNASVEVRHIALMVKRAGEKITVARLAVEHADENLRSITGKYRNGLATSAELLDAGVALVQANANHTAALVEREIARVRLKKATGELAGE